MRWLLALLFLLVPAAASAADFRVTSCDCGKLVLVQTDTLVSDPAGVTATLLTFGDAGGDGVAPLHQTRARFDCSKGVMTRQSERTLTRPSAQGFAALSEPGPPAGFDPEIIQPGTPLDAAMAAVCPGQVASPSAVVKASSLAEAYDYNAHVFQHRKSALAPERLRLWAEAYRQAEIVRPPRWKQPEWFGPVRMVAVPLLMVGFGFGFAAIARRFGRMPRNEVRYPLAAAALGPFAGLIGLGILAYGWLDPEAPGSITLGFAAFFGLLSLAMSPYLLWWRVVMDRQGFTFTDYWRRSHRYAWKDVVHVFETNNNDLVFILRDGRRLSLSAASHNIERFIDRTVENGTTALI
jgi:hypothetical protein